MQSQLKSYLRPASALAMLCLSLSASAAVKINVLSSRADLVSGGDALVEVVVPAGTKANELKLDLNGATVASQVQLDSQSGNFRGLITGLRNGENSLSAAVQRDSAKLKVVNYPITGPILSGPHLTPYECRTVESGLGDPLDANCSAKQKIEYFYRGTDGKFKPLPAGALPADVSSTITNDGKSVQYIVRVDSGTINRTIYRIAILDPSRGAAGAWHPDAAWNHKLAVSFGGGSGTQYNQGTNQATAALNDLYLSRGFAFMVATELVNQLHSNAVLQGESLMMLKEYFVEHYGVPKWTVGNGGSGGAIQQQLITELYPGLLDGLQPTMSFPDSSLHTADCGLLQNLWRKVDAAVWTDAKKAAVEGYTKGTCAAWERSFVPVLTATNVKGCAMNDVSKVYDPIKNPKGSRCTLQEMRANIYGVDPKTGFARKTQDNIGLQYGLAGLNSGALTVDEFLELNEKVGGNDIDGGFVAQRAVGDVTAIKALYASGLMNSGGGGLANVPILHSRGYTDAIGDIHDRHRDFTIRARLQKANGSADNQVIWQGPARAARGEGDPPQPQGAQEARSAASSVNLAALSLDTMNKWLDNMAADPAPLSMGKVVKHKPADAVDACWTSDGQKIVERASFDGSSLDAKGRCNALYPIHGEPRLVAGAPLTNEVVKCQLKRVNYADYKATFSADQKKRMDAVFPGGVCDFSRPGVGQVPFKGTYQKY
ncbi:MAG TPA: DUF6351 family protein [Steroidobacteraceae bacterium]|nr:DUF6351 family protein [Steroidobacteraceae bacterium]